MNKVILMGRLTRDPEIRYSQGASQTAVGRFTIAVDRRFKREGQPEADFFNCTTFNRQSEFVEKYLHRGTKVVVVGSIQNNNYTNNNGEKVYSVQVIVDEIEFAESKSASQDYNGADAPMEQAPTPSAASGDGFINIEDGIEDELPF